MPVNLSIKNAPDDVVQRLRERAARNHRSLQGELMAIIEEAVKEPKPARYLNVDEVLAEVRKLGTQSPERSRRRSFGRTAMVDTVTDKGRRCIGRWPPSCSMSRPATRWPRRSTVMQLVAPSLLDFEMANVCLSKMRRHPDQRDALLAAFRWRSRTCHRNAGCGSRGRSCTCRANRLTTTMRAICGLRDELGVELVTLDRQLAEAAEKFQ